MSYFNTGIKSIQRGTVTIAADATSGTATISSVDVTKTELRMLGHSHSGTSSDHAISPRIALTSDTVITATRSAGSGFAAGVISWELTERYG